MNLADADMFVALMNAPELAEETMKEGKGLTWSQIQYWLVCAGLLLIGFVATVWGGPWEWVRPIVKELGPGFFTAGLLAVGRSVLSQGVCAGRLFGRVSLCASI
jgi:hypothetical protein